MANIKVRSSNNSIIVRVGQTNATKVVASNAAASITASGTLVEVNSDVLDTGRAANTFLMYNGSDYVHVDASQIMDLADTTDDDTIDYGSF
jgi:hypothetical protein